LVNRFWCKTVIPILWRDPWCYEDHIDYQKKCSLYHIITFSLPDDIKESLTSQGIQLFPISHQSPLFDYLSFCKSINVKVIKNIISIGSSSTYDRFLLQQEIYNLFIRKFPEIKYLDIRSIEHQIFYFPKANTSLESLCELKCDISIDSIYFYGLACICKYIQRFIIINTIDPNININIDSIVKFIEAQKNLRYFEWKDDFIRDLDLYEFCFKDIHEKTFLALEKKADTINHLIFDFQECRNYYESSPISINLSYFH